MPLTIWELAAAFLLVVVVLNVIARSRREEAGSGWLLASFGRTDAAQLAQ